MCEKLTFTIFNQNFLLNFGVVQVGSLFLVEKFMRSGSICLTKKAGG